MTDELICNAFNVEEKRAKELIETYARKNFEKYVKGEITNGQFLSTFIDLDELTTSEKCFLTAHSAVAARLACEQMTKQARLMQLISDGII